MPDSLPRHPFVLKITARPEDIDEQHHVSNVAIVRFMNQAAITHSEALGYDSNAYRRLGGMFVVRRHEIDYRNAAYLGDELLALTWPSRLQRATAERRHRIIRSSDQKTIAEGSTFGPL